MGGDGIAMKGIHNTYEYSTYEVFEEACLTIKAFSFNINSSVYIYSIASKETPHPKNAVPHQKKTDRLDQAERTSVM